MGCNFCAEKIITNGIVQTQRKVNVDLFLIYTLYVYTWRQMEKPHSTKTIFILYSLLSFFIYLVFLG